VDMELTVVSPCSVLTSADERLHPTRGLIGQKLLTTHAADNQDQRTCSVPLTATPVNKIHLLSIKLI